MRNPLNTLIFLSLATFLGIGCVTTPNNGQVFCDSDRTNPITFSGYAQHPNATIDLYNGFDPAMPNYTLFASTQSSAQATTVNGTSLYAWTTSGVVPHWKHIGGGGGRQAYLRVEENGGSLNEMGFFDDQRADGRTWTQCIMDEMASKSLFAAAWSCRSEDYSGQFNILSYPCFP